MLPVLSSFSFTLPCTSLPPCLSDHSMRIVVIRNLKISSFCIFFDTILVKDYETYYRGEEEPFYYKSIYHTSQYLLIFNILILDYNISIFQYIYLTLSLHLPFFIALSIYCFIALLLYLFIAVYIALSL